MKSIAKATPGSAALLDSASLDVFLGGAGAGGHADHRVTGHWLGMARTASMPAGKVQPEIVWQVEEQ